jgi:serine/threonine protein kinase
MGTVFKAVDEQTGATVAVKLIDVRDTGEVERSRREAKTLAQLAHPAIVHYVADGVTDSAILYLAMQWVDGVTASERLASAGFTLRETVTMIGRIGSALGAAHAAGILHRDVKPSNVLIANNDPATAMLIDFGVARHNKEMSLTRTGTTIGTPGYMAPEQARGERNLTPAVDVFSLGCLLYECATGRPAFSGTLRAALLTKIMFGEPDPMAALCPEAPPRLLELVDTMLLKDPRGRPATGDSVAQALAAIADIPAGPRRTNRGMTETPTIAPPSAAGAHAHCLVLASKGHPDEPMDLPSEAAIKQLAASIARWAAEPVLLQTGTIVIHLSDTASSVTRRAAWCALATKQVLPDYTVVVSALESSLAVVADASTHLLSVSALAMIFKKLAAAGVVIDPSIAPWLQQDFEVDMSGTPRLIGPRRA